MKYVPLQPTSFTKLDRLWLFEVLCALKVEGFNEYLTSCRFKSGQSIEIQQAALDKEWATLL